MKPTMDQMLTSTAAITPHVAADKSLGAQGSSRHLPDQAGRGGLAGRTRDADRPAGDRLHENLRIVGQRDTALYGSLHQWVVQRDDAGDQVVLDDDILGAAGGPGPRWLSPWRALRRWDLLTSPTGRRVFCLSGI